MNTPIKKILWTVDPFAEEKDLQRSTAWAIKDITQGLPSIIEPVYFLSTYLAEGVAPVALQGIYDLQTTGQKELNKILSRVNLENVRPLHVISEPYPSLRDGIAKINDIAKRWKADLIVTSTHARKGLARLFLGSFAETLLLHSEVPLFFVNPHWKRQSKFKHILFPTDFSIESKEAFLQVLEIAQSLQSEVTLFHKLAYVWPPTIALTMGVAPLYADVFDRELEARKQDALNWAEKAKSKGITVSTYVDYKKPDSVAQAILRTAKKKHGMIAMASKSGPTKTVLLGSTTRKVVRESPFPVWVLHPKAKVQEKTDKIRSIKPVRKKLLFSVTEEDIEHDLERIPHNRKPA